MRWRIGAVLAVVLIAAGAWWHLMRPPVQSASAVTTPATNAVTVEAAPVKMGSIRRQIEAVGSLRSSESVIIRPEVSGRISDILFQEGQKITSGTPLVRLDMSIPRAQVDQMNAALALSKVNFERAQELMKKGAGSQRTYDEALAKMRADEASLALAQATLDKMTLVAPFDGILGLRKVSLGDYVNPGQDIVNIESIETLKVDFRVSEIYAAQLKVGQAINIRLDAIPGATFDGEVYAIDPAHDPNGRAVILRARTINKNGLLRSGMFARVALIIEADREGILVPETAIVPMGQEQFVFVLDNSKVKLTKLKTGQRRGGLVEVAQGLETTSVIITEGALKLRDGMTVKANLEKAG
ncbi:MAG: efflux RND transporter periplasmic adaptor subunit [Hyphomicrobiaceae bacterium]